MQIKKIKLVDVLKMNILGSKCLVENNLLKVKFQLVLYMRNSSLYSIFFGQFLSSFVRSFQVLVL